MGNDYGPHVSFLSSAFLVDEWLKNGMQRLRVLKHLSYSNNILLKFVHCLLMFAEVNMHLCRDQINIW